MNAKRIAYDAEGHQVCKVCRIDKPMTAFRPQRYRGQVLAETTCRTCTARQAEQAKRARAAKVGDVEYVEA